MNVPFISSPHLHSHTLLLSSLYFLSPNPFFNKNNASKAIINEVTGKFSHSPVSPKGQNRRIKATGTIKAFDRERIVAGKDLLMAIRKL